MDLTITITGTIDDDLPAQLAIDIAQNAQVLVDAIRALCLERGGTVASEITAATVTIGDATTNLTLPAPTLVDG